MEKINFQNAIQAKAPYIIKDGNEYRVINRQVTGGTPSNATNLNNLQNNIERGIGVANNEIITFSTSSIIKNGYYDEELGKYVDVYKDIIGINSPTGGTQRVSVGLDIKKILSIEGTVTQPNGNVTDLNYWVSSTDYSCIFYDVNASTEYKYFTWRTGTSYGFGNAKIILKYTKND